jgi:hypothetical protein
MPGAAPIIRFTFSNSAMFALYRGKTPSRFISLSIFAGTGATPKKSDAFLLNNTNHLIRIIGGLGVRKDELLKLCRTSVRYLE